MANVTSVSASSFLNSIGVNTHVPYTDGGYANISNIAADLSYLGISDVRDGISDGTNGSASLSSFVTLAQQGVKFTIGVVDASVTDLGSLDARIALVVRLVQAVPGSVIAIEGANEINNWPVTYNGVSGLQAALDLQKDLYTAVHSNPALSGIPVDYFTGYGAGTVGVGPDPATTLGLADADTQHPYPNVGAAPGSVLDPATALSNEGTASGPFVYTETGYSTYGSGSVSEDVQAKYSLDLLLDAVTDGASHVDLYQLMDAYAPGSPQGDDGYGLFAPGNVPKLAAVAIHNMTTIIADPGGRSAAATASVVDYSVSGLPSTGRTLEITKSTGVTDIAVWAEPQIWNASTNIEVAAPTTSAAVQLGATYSTVSVYDPMVGTTAIETLSDVNALQISLTDHPLILEVGAVADPVGVSTSTATNAPQPAPATLANYPLFGSTAHDLSSIGGEVFALYDAILGRAPDPIGFEGWVAAANSGTSISSIAQSMLASTEYTGGHGSYQALTNEQFLDQLYETALHRQPDAGGLQSYESALSSGTIRQDVATSIALSAEHAADLQSSLMSGVFVPSQADASVARLYHGILGRDPDAGGLASAESAVAQGSSLTSLAQGMLNSTEYNSQHAGQKSAQFVTSLYNGALGRDPDAPGLSNYLGALSSGSSQASIAVSISESGEATSHLLPSIEAGLRLS